MTSTEDRGTSLDTTKAKLEISDPLSEVSRKQRKALLGLSLVSVAMVYAELVPTSISAIGVTVEDVDQVALLRVFAISVVYFLVAFTTYAYSDFVAWRINLSDATLELARIFDEIEERGGPEDAEHSHQVSSELRKRYFWYTAASRGSVARALFEFAVPIVFGAIAVYSLLVFEPSGNRANHETTQAAQLESAELPPSSTPSRNPNQLAPVGR